jgi:glyoxylase-like metal-dependent hydrolase (beta-lactamase superfamily II)
VKVGDIEITPVSDGWFHMPKEFFPGADWSGHEDLFDHDGKLDLPIGCFVIRTGDVTVLVDAGFGPLPHAALTGGQLPAALAANGVRPEDVDVVVCTHLHLDHAGWLVHDGEPFFPNATVRFGAGDWERWVDGAREGGPRARLDAAARHLAAARRHRRRRGQPCAGCHDALGAGAHDGHQVLVVSSGDERALLLGDSITCPLQLAHEDWGAASDMDPALAQRTRELLWQELAADGTVGVGAHFPELQHGRVLRGQGRTWFT